MALADVLDEPRAHVEEPRPSRRQERLRVRERHLRVGVGASAVLIALASLLTVTTGGSPDEAPPEAVQSVPVPSTPVPQPPVTLFDEVKRDLAMQLVSSAENSSLDWQAQYGYIEWDVEGVPAENRGYTAGLIGFCSACGDMTVLLERYAELAPDNPLVRYIPAVRREAERGMGRATQEGLGPEFEAAWKKAAQDPLFRKAQDDRVEAGYFRPAVDQAIADGLPVLGQFMYFDAMVMHGPGDSAGDFGGIRAAALKVARTPADGGDVTAYLNAFLDARTTAMQGEVAHRDTTRVETAQRRFLQQGNLGLDLPLTWAVYGDRYRVNAPGARPVAR